MRKQTFRLNIKHVIYPDMKLHLAQVSSGLSVNNYILTVSDITSMS